jgi:hypothetical protein
MKSELSLESQIALKDARISILKERIEELESKEKLSKPKKHLVSESSINRLISIAYPTYYAVLYSKNPIVKIKQYLKLRLVLKMINTLK